jgi:hypothetical protein
MSREERAAILHGIDAGLQEWVTQVFRVFVGSLTGESGGSTRAEHEQKARRGLMIGLEAARALRQITASIGEERVRSGSASSGRH